LKPKRKSRFSDGMEKPVPVPESVRQEDGREVKVYPKHYADGYQPVKNVRSKNLM